MLNMLKIYIFLQVISCFVLKKIKTEKVGKLIANFHDKLKYLIHIRNLKPKLNHILLLKKFHRAIKFNQKAWIKSYIDMNV